MRFFLVFFVLLLICSSCFDDSSDIDNEIKDLTIQASIKEGDFARVYLTNAIPFDSKIDSLALLKAIEFQAKVNLHDSQGNSELLTLNIDENKYPFIFYHGNSIKGETGVKYFIDVEVKGEIFNSETEVPLAPSVHSHNFVDSFIDGELDELFKDLKLVLNNINGEIQYYKFTVNDNSLNNEFLPANPYIINTENVSGDTFLVLLEFNGFTSGNELTLDVISISKEEYEFLEAIGGDKTTLLEGFSFNEQIPSNILGNAFGYWSGENSLSLSLKVQKEGGVQVPSF